MLSYQSWKFVWIRLNGGQQLRIVIITKVFVRNENIHHSLILLACGYLLICNMQQFSHYGVYVPFSVKLSYIPLHQDGRPMLSVHVTQLNDILTLVKLVAPILSDDLEYIVHGSKNQKLY